MQSPLLARSFPCCRSCSADCALTSAQTKKSPNKTRTQDIKRDKHGEDRKLTSRIQEITKILANTMSWFPLTAEMLFTFIASI